MTNYFIANGMILDTGMGVEEIETTIQDSLDETTSGMAQFRLKELSDSCVSMMFIRDLIMGDLYNPIIYDCDMNLILNIGIEAFIPSKAGGYPLLYPLVRHFTFPFTRHRTPHQRSGTPQATFPGRLHRHRRDNAQMPIPPQAALQIG